MFSADAAEFGIVPDQVGELASLLHQVTVRESRDLLLEVAHAQQFAELEARIVEAQRLIEIRGEKISF